MLQSICFYKCIFVHYWVQHKLAFYIMSFEYCSAMALINHNIIISEKHRIFLWCYMHVVVQCAWEFDCKKQCSMGNCAHLTFSHSKNTAQYQSLHCLSLWLNVKWAQLPCYTASCNQILRPLYYNMHIASQEYSMFFTDYYVVIYESHGTTVLKWHYVEMQVYAALNSVQIYIYRNIWTVAFRQWWGLFPTGLGFVSIYLIECAMYCKSASLIHVYITSTLYEHVAIIDSFLSV